MSDERAAQKFRALPAGARIVRWMLLTQDGIDRGFYRYKTEARRCKMPHDVIVKLFGSMPRRTQ